MMKGRTRVNRPEKTQTASRRLQGLKEQVSHLKGLPLPTDQLYVKLLEWDPGLERVLPLLLAEGPSAAREGDRSLAISFDLGKGTPRKSLKEKLEGMGLTRGDGNVWVTSELREIERRKREETLLTQLERITDELGVTSEERMLQFFRLVQQRRTSEKYEKTETHKGPENGRVHGHTDREDPGHLAGTQPGEGH